MKTAKAIVFGLACVGAATIFTSCDSTETRETTDGIKYTLIKQGKESPKNGEFVLYHLQVTNEKDSVFISTDEQGSPGVLQYNDSIPAQTGMDEIFLNLKKGDSIYIEDKAVKVFGAGSVPFFLQEDDKVKIRIGAFAVMGQEEVEAYFAQLQEQQAKREEEKALKQLETDTQLIQDYLAENNIEATRTESGLYYVIKENGNGPAIEPGKTAAVHYAGFLLDGTIFDTSMKSVAQENGIFNEQRDQAGNYTPFEVRVGAGRVIRGWDEGLALLKKGDKATLYIPSPLGYGPRQSGPVIGPNSVLVFDVEIVDVMD
ncbi:FKBP-type peptidylprolyl isomerase [Nitritalea halalkaliphila LW7]|uniref:Peptidyl-prolyl cis-trans isomerase n=1 Tax=Nitritalea halalkaliphila LW7 TaxID=1189621 RepID=I5BVW6_9BACT|nr:FKBP-type peptidyl-prolyl cis-trans isomerase [Nitritalea halalkaliphila]EIM73718.1 FKBP-type peptidylprolyl isomerase [Nitritalea halalkaliphila LW7]